MPLQSEILCPDDKESPHMTDLAPLRQIIRDRAHADEATALAAPLIASAPEGGDVMTIRNPFYTDDVVSEVRLASNADIEAALNDATPWAAPVSTRAGVLRKAADIYEENFDIPLAIK